MSNNEKKTGRKPGRPKKADAPVVPWAKIDTLLVMGEEVVDENGDTIVHYPSYREVAEQFGVAPSLIASYAKRRACMRRRKDAEARTRALAESEIIERRASDLAISTEDQLRIVDRGIIEFGKALDEGRARIDTVGDLNSLLRLKQLLLGNADTRQEVVHGLSLEDLQKKHQAMLRVITETSAAERREGTRLLVGAEVKSATDPKFEEGKNEHDPAIRPPEIEQDPPAQSPGAELAPPIPPDSPARPFDAEAEDMSVQFLNARDSGGLTDVLEHMEDTDSELDADVMDIEDEYGSDEAFDEQEDVSARNH